MRYLVLIILLMLCANRFARAEDPFLCELVLQHFAAVHDLQDFEIDAIADFNEEQGRAETAELLRIHRAIQRLKTAQVGAVVPPEIAALVARRAVLLNGRNMWPFAVPVPTGTSESPFLRNRNHFHPLGRSGFAMSDLVTQGQWSVVFGDNPASYRHQGVFRVGKKLVDPQLPVETVSPLSAMAFANRVSELEGREPVYRMDHLVLEGTAEAGTLRAASGNVHVLPTANGYRLPSSTQMADAVLESLGGTGYFYGSEAGFDMHAWSARNSRLAFRPTWGHGNGLGPQRTKAKRPNRFGVHDIHGNVGEILLEEGGVVQVTTSDSNSSGLAQPFTYRPPVLQPDHRIGFRLVRPSEAVR